jgi:hypothetical protein
MVALFVSCSTVPGPEVIPTFEYTFESEDCLDQFEVTRGASIQGTEKWSEVQIDSTTSYEGRASLMLRVNRETTRFYFVGTYLPIDKTSYRYVCYVKGDGIRRDGSQFNNSYVGFFIRYLNGKKKFVVTHNNGTFNWREETGFIRISNSADIDSIQFGVFLSKSGSMWVDNIKLYLD